MVWPMLSGERYVYRSFHNTSQIMVNYTFSVVLDIVSTSSDHFYALEEYMPVHFTILSVEGAYNVFSVSP